MGDCRRCGAALASALVCEACGSLQECADSPGPFAALGLEPAWRVDPKRVRARALELSRRLHPDFFTASADGERALAVTNSAELNAARRTLDDEFRRADWLVRDLDGPGPDVERDMPQTFLMEVLEWNERLEAARDGVDDEPLDDLERSLRGERAELTDAIGDLLTPLPPAADPSLTEVRKHLNAVRYVDRALGELRELRLARASTRPDARP